MRPLWAAPNPAFCNACWLGIPWFSESNCPGCAIPFGSKFALSHSPTHRCGPCRKRPRRFDGAASAGPFEGALAEAIHRFKYKGCRAMAEPLGQAVFRAAARIPRPDLVIPVPLSRRRLMEREYNQALLLADRVAGRFGLPMDSTTLIRVRDTEAQTKLSERERRAGIRRAFRVDDPAAVEDKRVWLVDDVMTTGATAEECARTLKRAGAKAVYILTAARTLPPALMQSDAAGSA